MIGLWEVIEVSMLSEDKKELTPEQKIEANNEALERIRKKGESPALISALANLGRAYLESGDPPKALTQFDEG